MVLDLGEIQISRARLIDALTAEGVPGLTNGYANIHMLPMYQKKIAYGKKGFPWTSDICKREVSYEKGICPIAEELHDATYMSFLICLLDLDDEDITNIANAFKKVWNNLEDLR